MVDACWFPPLTTPFHLVVVHTFTQQRPEYVRPGLALYDVALGTGTGINRRIGNERFRGIVQDFAAAYLELQLQGGERFQLADAVVALVQQPHGGDTGGRFMERDAGGEWREVTAYRAREKCQKLLCACALRLRHRRAAANQEAATMSTTSTTTPSESTPGTPRHEPSVVAVPAAVVTPPQESSPAVMSAWPGPAASLPHAPLFASFSSSSAVTVAGGELPITNHTTTGGGWTSPVPPTTSDDNDVDDPAMIAGFLRDIDSSSSSLDNGNGQELAATAAAAAASSTPPPPQDVDIDDPFWASMNYLDDPEVVAYLLDAMVDED
jgi:hypothetical protein